MEIIDIQNVSKYFSNHTALDDVSFSIREGVIFGLLGPNGAGKTTLIRILNQITFPDKGTVLFKGLPLNPSDISKIGYLPEERGLYKKMNVGEQAVYLARLKGVPKNLAIKRLQDRFEKFGIMGWWNRKVEELSKGMQQKVQFITTIIHEPEFLIFDEPFSGFDPINANLLKDEILELKKSGTTVILSTHNMASVEEICDDIVLINNSRKILEGSLSEVKKNFRENIFEIIIYNDKYLANLPPDFEVISDNTIDDKRIFTIKLSHIEQANNLLTYFMENATLNSFKEILPSMNDIFIQQVNRYNAQKNG
ncbi:ABC transporter ATP-binding protein [Bacteroidales bacterium OttesenSCG-928-B11]|nr:ABC transporter ATP-binding protein [Bacteroidales bacterium OttesenSCG-928-E04]MDL2313102.1 ABC transporter ATP-binding protein [Bacteroidales bacterium OttesenSCG-928-B11]MDL2326563.1 ABC transporter ATP-binding protein [Bacteroidales bacterium OttesenSCG-928-A14]